MSPEIITLGLVSLLLVVSNIYWMRHSQKLVDKIMSRDFTEYRSAELKKPIDKRPEQEPVVVRDDLAALNDFIY